MTTHCCVILTLSHQGAGCILSVSRRCVWCAARQGKESLSLSFAYRRRKKWCQYAIQLRSMTSRRHSSRTYTIHTDKYRPGRQVFSHSHRHTAGRGGGGTVELHVYWTEKRIIVAEGAIFQGALFSRDLFLMNKCLNRDHHSCDKPLKAKVFFILYPSRAV